MSQKKHKEYWIKRAIERDKKLEKDIRKIEKQLKKLFVGANEEIKKELAYFYASKKNLTDFEKYRLEATLNAVNKSLDDLYHKEESLLNKSFVDIYYNHYKDASVDLGINISFDTINDNLIKDIIKTNWSGLNFSERIWDIHRPKLGIAIKETLKSGFIRGDSLQDMARILSSKFNTSYNHSLTLVHTESCWIMNESTKNSYRDAGLEKYEYLAFIDKRTTKECENLNGKIFNIKDGVAGVNLPPMHYRCRSAIMPIID